MRDQHEQRDPIPGHPGGALANIAIGPVDPEHADQFAWLLWWVIVFSVSGIVGFLAVDWFA